MFKVFKTPEFKKELNFYKAEIIENKRNFIIAMSSAVLWCFLVVIQPYLIKIIGPTTSKFTAKNKRFFLIQSKDYGGEDVNLIKPHDVISFIENNNLLN